MFSDAYHPQTFGDTGLIKVACSTVTKKTTIDDSLIGGNASAEDPDAEKAEDASVSGLELVLDFSLQEQPPYTQKQFMVRIGYEYDMQYSEWPINILS